MKKITKILLVAVIVMNLSACLDNYDKFGEELYKKYISIVSRGNDNEFSVVCRIDTTDGWHDISVTVSGTNKIDREVDLVFERDTTLLPKYNFSRYEHDETKYAKEMQYHRFQSLSLTLSPYSTNVYGLLPFNIEPEYLALLCPDSAYFIPIAIKSASEYELHETKYNALIRIFPKNRYAETQTTTYYTSKGFYGDGSNPVDRSIIAPQVPTYPLKDRSIRTFVAPENPSPNTFTPNVINRYSIEIMLTQKDSLLITPYRPEAGLLEIEQLGIPAGETDFAYINKYTEQPDRYVPGKIDQRFFMHYKWRNRERITDTWSEWRTVRVIMSRLSMQ